MRPESDMTIKAVSRAPEVKTLDTKVLCLDSSVCDTPHRTGPINQPILDYLP